MANLRSAKKDVIFFMNEVISDCYMFMCIHPDKNQEEAAKIIDQAMALGENLFEQINNYPSAPGRALKDANLRKEYRKQVKAHFAQISGKLLSATDEMFDSLSKLTK